MNEPTEQGLPEGLNPHTPTESTPVRSTLAGPPRDFSSPQRPEPKYSESPTKAGPANAGKFPRVHPVPEQANSSPGAHLSYYTSGDPAPAVPSLQPGAGHSYPDPSLHAGVRGNIPSSPVGGRTNDPPPSAASHNLQSGQALPSDPFISEGEQEPENPIQTEHGWHVTQQFLRDSNVVDGEGNVPNIGHLFLPGNITPLTYNEPPPDRPGVSAHKFRRWRRGLRQMLLANELFKAGVPGPFLVEQNWLLEIDHRVYIRTIGRLKMRDGEPVWLDRHEQPLGPIGRLPIVNMKELVDECLGRLRRREWVDPTAPAPELPEEYEDSDPGAGYEDGDDDDDEEDAEDEEDDGDEEDEEDEEENI
ncbi:hypothetical protein F4810DRAFT_719585 [Camillea tinctor]|nr:hypothetical protein F4810DRAFT_719585 [Camillea tinctor]